MQYHTHSPPCNLMWLLSVFWGTQPKLRFAVDVNNTVQKNLAHNNVDDDYLMEVGILVTK
jgi:hypothetical protein